MPAKPPLRLECLAEVPWFKGLDLEITVQQCSFNLTGQNRGFNRPNGSSVFLNYNITATGPGQAKTLTARPAPPLPGNLSGADKWAVSGQGCCLPGAYKLVATTGLVDIGTLTGTAQRQAGSPGNWGGAILDTLSGVLKWALTVTVPVSGAFSNPIRPGDASRMVEVGLTASTVLSESYPTWSAGWNLFEESASLRASCDLQGLASASGLILSGPLSWPSGATSYNDPAAGPNQWKTAAISGTIALKLRVV